MRMIDADALLSEGIKVSCGFNDNGLIMIPMRDVNKSIKNAPTVDAVEVVRCKDCKHGILDEEEGLWMCVFTADYDEELGVFHGFIQHNTADYYCADGERKEENAAD